jgi:hypothetical protein
MAAQKPPVHVLALLAKAIGGSLKKQHRPVAVPPTVGKRLARRKTDK